MKRGYAAIALDASAVKLGQILVWSGGVSIVERGHVERRKLGEAAQRAMRIEGIVGDRDFMRQSPRAS